MLKSNCTCPGLASLRKGVSLAIIGLSLIVPLVAQAVDFCFADDANVAVTDELLVYDDMMGYYTFTCTETYTWDCYPMADTSKCTICELDVLSKSSDNGQTYDEINTVTSSNTAPVCTNGNSAVYYLSVNLNPSSFYKIDYFIKALPDGGDCGDDSGWSLRDTSEIMTGPGG